MSSFEGRRSEGASEQDTEAVKRPLIIGEVLFDEFPDGNQVLGGAPFNVAWNLQGLGLEPLFVSSVGADDEGREVREKMEAWGMDVSGLQVAKTRPTGKVRIELRGGEPQYDIIAEQAYDEVRLPDIDPSSADFTLLYVGSLASRGATTRATVQQMMTESPAPRFVDINMRPPWFSKRLAASLLREASWVKMNVDELSFMTNSACRTAEEIGSSVSVLQRAHSAQRFLITCGGSGAYVIDEDGASLFASAPAPKPFVDAVGAGDAFSAAVIAGVHRKLPIADILKAAVRFASATCSIRGATSPDRSHYVFPSSTAG